MAIWQCQIAHGSVTSLPEDAAVNTWNFEGSESATNTENMFDIVWDFYAEEFGVSTIHSRMSEEIYDGNATLKAYCLADPEPRVPRATDIRTWTPTGGPTMPHEVSLCLSYAAAPLSGQPQARRRGRLYLPAMKLSNNSSAGRPTTSLREDVGAAAEETRLAANASTTWEWVVWSRVNNAGYQVVGGWIDNSWDTQRRRGVAPTTRYTWGS